MADTAGDGAAEQGGSYRRREGYSAQQEGENQGENKQCLYFLVFFIYSFFSYGLKAKNLFINLLLLLST